MSFLTLIVAATLANGIGQGGRLPWKLPHDMAYFTHVTTHAPEGKTNAVIMGRKTWESIPAKNRPLKNRKNILLSSNPDYFKDSGLSALATGSVIVCASLNDALLSLTNSKNPSCIYRPFIMGGSSVYESALQAAPSTCGAQADRILMTRILSPAFENCDAFFPEFREMKSGDGAPAWTQSTHEDLEAWVGNQVPRSVQQENGVEYEFQMWTRRK